MPGLSGYFYVIHSEPPMTCYNLEIKNHEEYGYLGIVCKDLKRDYFDPTVGVGIAHDIIEHPVRPHENGYVDELMACGAFLAGRGINKGILGDVSNMVHHSLIEEYGTFEIEPSNNYLTDKDLMARIESEVIKGLIEAVNEYEDKTEQYTELPERYKFDVKSIVGWICKGYQLFKKRFHRIDYEVSTYLFDQIVEQCDNWLKSAEEGDSAKLYVCFSNFEVRMIF
jgi:hypothetical protein